MSNAAPDVRLVEANQTQENPKHANFRRLALKRVPKALDALEMIGRLGAPTYQYTEDEVVQIMGALHRQLDDVGRRLMHTKENKPQFSFE